MTDAKRFKKIKPLFVPEPDERLCESDYIYARHTAAAACRYGEHRRSCKQCADAHERPRSQDYRCWRGKILWDAAMEAINQRDVDMTRCPERSEGQRCIRQVDHDGDCSYRKAAGSTT